MYIPENKKTAKQLTAQLREVEISKLKSEKSMLFLKSNSKNFYVNYEASLRLQIAEKIGKKLSIKGK